ncbi:MAG: glycogen-binding domain-containing protein, partial [Flavisolibacter sp.]|nr:glycogen-binding domain-containing protein [Flavisolibacter sp.]
MKKVLLCIELLLIGLISLAQYKVTFVIHQLPSYHKSANQIYLVGSFNNWNPGDKKLQLTSTNGKPGITIELASGRYEYKFTGGSWENVESMDGGMPTQNRKVVIESDTTISVEIE